MAKKKKTKGSSISASAQRIWLAGLGALATAEEEGSRVFNNLVSKGEKYQTGLRRPVGKAAQRVKGGVQDIRSRAGKTLQRVEDVFDDQVSSALHRIGVPSRREISALSRKVEKLTGQLAKKKAAPRRKVAKKRTTRKRKAS